MHFKNERSVSKGIYLQKGTSSRVMVGSSPKLVFDQMAAPVPEIMDDPLYMLLSRHLTAEKNLDIKVKAGEQIL
jgi:hypothetical protein